MEVGKDETRKRNSRNEMAEEENNAELGLKYRILF